MAAPRSRHVASLVLAAVLGFAAAARADAPAESDARARAKVLFDEAERAAADLRFAEALAAYEQAANVDPAAPFARVARVRAADLASHAEGNFAPLARLEAVRRRPDTDRATIDALARDASSFPDGRVRAEARVCVADALWHRFGALDQAATALDQALADPAADKLTRALAVNELVALERQRGALDAAYRAVSRFPDLAPALRVEVARLVRRVWLRRGSTVLLGLLAAVGVASFARLARRRRDLDAAMRAVIRPRSMAFTLYLGGVAALLVRLHGDGDVRPFLWLGLGVLGMDAIARAWRLGAVDTRAPARIARAVFCVAGVLAAAFLSLERADAGYLESFGL
jgi:tetratricopeptide (TPR) repeat protein